MKTFLEDVATFSRVADDTWVPSTYKRGKRKNDPCMRNSKGESRDMTPEEKRRYRQSSSSDEQTPREAAEAATARDAADYAYARTSAIPNLGEDVKGSARHVRNRWRGLAEAEAEGTAAELVKKDQLLRNEPPSFPEPTSINGLAVLAAHLAVGVFPASPDRHRGDPSRHTPEVKRGQYLDAYRAVKKEAEEAARTEIDPYVVMDRVHKVYSEQIRLLRGLAPGQYHGGTDRNNPIANALIDSLGRTLRQLQVRFYKKNSVGERLLDFVGRLNSKSGGDVTALRGFMAGHVKDVLEGSSYNETFGKPGGEAGSTGKERLDVSKLYVETARRTGGPVIDASTVAAGLSYVGGVLGMRGLQWGNSVSDEERQHHLQKAAESFADLTDVLGLPAEMASFGGKLALAIGARGKGTALAHYEPSDKVINLTRNKGVGSLAHEWGHFLDEMLAGGNGNFLSLTSYTRGDPRDPVHVAMQTWRRAMDSSGFRARLRTQLGKDLGDGLLSQKKANYWFGTEECFARCFERHVQAKLQGQARENTYLTGVKPHHYWPSPEEVAQMAPAFDALMAAARNKFLTRTS